MQDNQVYAKEEKQQTHLDSLLGRFCDLNARLSKTVSVYGILAGRLETEPPSDQKNNSELKERAHQYENGILRGLDEQLIELNNYIDRLDIFGQKMGRII